MASTPPPPAQAPVLSPANPPRPTQLLQSPSAPLLSVKSEAPSAEPRDAAAGVSSLPAEPSPSPAAVATSYTITIPSCSGWFTWDRINGTERKVLPEFFDGKSVSKNPEVYKYYRDSIIRRFRANPSRKLTFTDARRELIGDVGSIRRVFDFLEEWGLINYTPLAKPSTKEKRELEEGSEKKENARRICTNCRSPCSMACFTTDKADIILCARCFVRGDYRPGLSSTDFKRVDITEEAKIDWTDKETLHLLEAILQYGEDWKKVAEHVGTRSEVECVARFIKLPSGEQFLGSEVCGNSNQRQKKDEIITTPGEEGVSVQGSPKRMRLTPLADASNPIMAQVAFLSAMVGSKVAETAAQAAISALHKVEKATDSANDEILQTSIVGSAEESSALDNQTSSEILIEAIAEARSQLDKEEKDVEQYLSDIVQVQMKEIQDKILHFEELELLLEKERLQLRYMKDLLFADRLSILQHNTRPAPRGSEVEKIKPHNHVT